MRNFPSQRVPCIPIRKVGILWEAGQNVGMVSYKTGFLYVRQNGIPPVLALVSYLLNALYLSRTQCQNSGNSFIFPILQKSKNKFYNKFPTFFWQLCKYIFGGVLILSLVRKVHASQTKKFSSVPWELYCNTPQNCSSAVGFLHHENRKY